MGEPKQATDTEVMGRAAAKYLEEHGEDVMITDLEDVSRLVGVAAGQIHDHGAAHLITGIAVWPFLPEAEALITLDLPSGIRLCTLCISRKHLIPDYTQAADATAVIRHVLANVLSAARVLAGEYETEVSRRMGRGPRKRADQDSGENGISGYFEAGEIKALVITAAEVICDCQVCRMVRTLSGRL